MKPIQVTIDEICKELDELEVAANALDVHYNSAIKCAIDDLTRYYSDPLLRALDREATLSTWEELTEDQKANNLLCHELYGKP